MATTRTADRDRQVALSLVLVVGEREAQVLASDLEESLRERVSEDVLRDGLLASGPRSKLVDLEGIGEEAHVPDDVGIRR